MDKNDNNNSNGTNNENIAKQIISEEIDRVNVNPSIVKANACAACHVLFSIIDKIQVSESAASDLLSQILFHSPQPNKSFIEMVENVHMKQRMIGIPFSIKTRKSKDNYVNSNLRNVLLTITYISLEIAKISEWISMLQQRSSIIICGKRIRTLTQEY
jgi:hypothetical protein